MIEARNPGRAAPNEMDKEVPMIIALVIGSLVVAAILTPVVMGLVSLVWGLLGWATSTILGVIVGAAHGAGWLVGRLALVGALGVGVGAGGAAAMAML